MPKDSELSIAPFYATLSIGQLSSDYGSSVITSASSAMDLALEAISFLDRDITSIQRLAKDTNWVASIGSGSDAFSIRLRKLTERSWGALLTENREPHVLSFVLRHPDLKHSITYEFDWAGDITTPTTMTFSVSSSLSAQWLDGVESASLSRWFTSVAVELGGSCGYMGALFGPEFCRANVISDDRVQIDSEVLGFGWGTVLGPGHITRLDPDTLDRTLSKYTVRRLENSSLTYIQCIEPIYGVSDESIAQLKSALAPILPRPSTDDRFPLGFPLRWI